MVTILIVLTVSDCFVKWIR